MGQSKTKSIKARTYKEFVFEVAEDCFANLTEEQKEIINDNPNSLDYHFGYCMYIRNHYIYNNIDNLDFEVEPDSLSGTIMNVLIEKVTGDDPYDTFQHRLYGHKEYIRLRKLYRKLFGRDAKELTEKYRGKYPSPKEESGYELLFRSLGISASYLSSSEEDNDNAEDFGEYYDKENAFENYKKENIRKEKVVNELIMELADIIWQADTIRNLAINHGVEERLIEEKMQDVRNKFATEKVYIPMGSCLLPFRDRIGEELYNQYRDELITELDDNPHLIEKLDLRLFHDRKLAKAVLKHPFAMCLLKEYQDDDEMVRYALECNGEAIQYVDERYINDRDWVKLAIEHSADSAIMYLECMKRYRNDREFVYLACKVRPYNFSIVDEAFHDDYDLVHMILSSDNYKQSIILDLSDRLKDDVSIAVLALKTDSISGFDMNEFSDRIRDNDEVAETIIKYHGLDSWEMFNMSDRIKEKYGFDENA